MVKIFYFTYTSIAADAFRIHSEGYQPKEKFWRYSFTRYTRFDGRWSGHAQRSRIRGKVGHARDGTVQGALYDW